MKLFKWTCASNDRNGTKHYLYTDETQDEPVTCTYCGDIVELEETKEVKFD